MRTCKKFLLVFIPFMLISACAGGIIQLPQKYALDGQLEQVKSIYKYGRILDWESVDNQSFIIEITPGDYYLLILKMPSPELLFLNNIRISSNFGMIRAGWDEVIVYNGAHMRSTYFIDRIYKIKGSQQMRAIRDQLTGKKDTPQKNNKGNSTKPGLPNNKGAEI